MSFEVCFLYSLFRNGCVWTAIVPPCFPEFASTLLRYGGPTP